MAKEDVDLIGRVIVQIETEGGASIITRTVTDMLEVLIQVHGENIRVSGVVDALDTLARRAKMASSQIKRESHATKVPAQDAGSTFAPGTEAIVVIYGEEYPTVVDNHGTQRFKVDTLVKFMCDEHAIDFNKLSTGFQNGLFPRREYIRFLAASGYSVDGLLDAVPGLNIDNPLWQNR